MNGPPHIFLLISNIGVPVFENNVFFCSWMTFPKTGLTIWGFPNLDFITERLKVQTALVPHCSVKRTKEQRFQSFISWHWSWPRHLQRSVQSKNNSKYKTQPSLLFLELVQGTVGGLVTFYSASLNRLTLFVSKDKCEVIVCSLRQPSLVTLGLDA